MSDDMIVEITDPAEIAQSIRQRRDFRLARTDWTQMSDSPLAPETVEAFRLYRQELRDLPQQYAEVLILSDVVFPTEPNIL